MQNTEEHVMLPDYPRAGLGLEGELKSSVAGFSLTDPSLPSLTSIVEK